MQLVAETKPVYGEYLNHTYGIFEVDYASVNLADKYYASIARVELLRSYLEFIVILRQNLTDPAVLSASKTLDEALNEFNRLNLLNITE